MKLRTEQIQRALDPCELLLIAVIQRAIHDLEPCQARSERSQQEAAKAREDAGAFLEHLGYFETKAKREKNFL